MNDMASTLSGRRCPIVLDLLMKRPGLVVMHEQILDALYEGGEQPEMEIVKVFINSVRKSSTHFRDMIRGVWGRGYRWQKPNDELMLAERLRLDDRDRPKYIRSFDGDMLTLEDLPGVGDEVWWTPKRKCLVLFAIKGGLLSFDEACRRYCATPAEIDHWQRLYKNYGPHGLRVRRAQTLAQIEGCPI